MTPREALELFEAAIHSLQRARDVGSRLAAFADLAVLLDRLEPPAIAATLYGASTRGDIGWVVHLPAVVDHLREVLGPDDFDGCVASGATMDLSGATQYAQGQIQLAQRAFTEPTSPPAQHG